MLKNRSPQERAPPVLVGLNAVIVAVTVGEPRILTVREDAGGVLPRPPETESAGTEHAGTAGERGSRDALPYGPLDPDADRTLELTLRRWVRRLTGIELGYVEQLYTFGDRDRGPMAGREGPRWISVAYLALVRESPPDHTPTARWQPWYGYFPWEDHRSGPPPTLERVIRPALERWVEEAESARTRRARRERAEIVFGLGGSGWDEERVLERYELLYEAGLVEEAARGEGSHLQAGEPAPGPRSGTRESLGRPMAVDHRRILATALGRVRGKLKYRPVVFELLPDRFTLLHLQRVVEALAGVGLHKQNFRRLVERQGLVEGTGEMEARTGGRPAELFRFRREVLLERRAPGVGLPGI